MGSLYAKQNNTTATEVYAEIQKAIDAAFSNPDPKIQEEWKKVNYKGIKPTPEEVIEYLVGRIHTTRGH